MTAWDVRYTEQFDNQVMELPEPVYDRVEASVDVLATNPGLARDYATPPTRQLAHQCPACATVYLGRRR